MTPLFVPPLFFNFSKASAILFDVDVLGITSASISLCACLNLLYNFGSLALSSFSGSLLKRFTNCFLSFLITSAIISLSKSGNCFFARFARLTILGCIATSRASSAILNCNLVGFLIFVNSFFGWDTFFLLGIISPPLIVFPSPISLNC